MMRTGKKIFLMLMAIALLTIGAAALYAGTLYNYSTATNEKIYKDLGRGTEKDDIIAATKPLTILLMGVDTDVESRGSAWEGGRSDSMILVTVNPKTKKTTMMSLTRDIMVELAKADGTSYGTAEKLNHSYAYGQAPMAIATIEKMMDIKIDRYVEINMDGLRELVDKLDGVTVNNTLGFTISIAAQEPAYTATIEPGRHLINGNQALVYSRMRYDDPEGDKGRQKRQREVIQAIVNKLIQLEGFTQYEKILDVLADNMHTDVRITAGTIPGLIGYKDSLDTIETYQLDGENQMIEGLSYQIPTSEELLKMQNIIKKSLGLPTKKDLTTNVKVYEHLFNQPTPMTVIDAFTGEKTEGTEGVTSFSETTTTGLDASETTPETEAEVPTFTEQQ